MKTGWLFLLLLVVIASGIIAVAFIAVPLESRDATFAISICSILLALIITIGYAVKVFFDKSKSINSPLPFHFGLFVPLFVYNFAVFTMAFVSRLMTFRLILIIHIIMLVILLVTIIFWKIAFDSVFQNQKK